MSSSPALLTHTPWRAASHSSGQWRVVRTVNPHQFPQLNKRTVEELQTKQKRAALFPTKAGADKRALALNSTKKPAALVKPAAKAKVMPKGKPASKPAPKSKAAPAKPADIQDQVVAWIERNGGAKAIRSGQLTRQHVKGMAEAHGMHWPSVSVYFYTYRMKKGIKGKPDGGKRAQKAAKAPAAPLTLTTAEMPANGQETATIGTEPSFAPSNPDGEI